MNRKKFAIIMRENVSKLKFIISNVSLNTLFMMDDKSYLIWRKCCTILCIVSFVIQNNQ